jgi:hypothetical protein
MSAKNQVYAGYAYGENNYDNERVQEMKRQFGEFRYP